MALYMSWVFNLVCTLLVAFCVYELSRKFRFLGHFVENAEHLTVRWEFPGAKHCALPVGMRKIVLTSKEPFSVLVGFRMRVLGGIFDGVDHYGAGTAKPVDGEYRLVISTWLGNGPVDFRFLCNVVVHNGDPPAVRIRISEYLQSLKPDVTYHPHWYQRLGFWA